MKKCLKQIIATGTIAIMMTTVTAIGASAENVVKNLESINSVIYTGTINAPKKTFIAKINNKRKVPSHNANFTIKGTKDNNYASIILTSNKQKRKLSTSISRRDRKNKGKVVLQSESKVTTTNAGCGVICPRNSSNKYYEYMLEATIANPDKNADPFSAKFLEVTVTQK